MTTRVLALQLVLLCVACSGSERPRGSAGGLGGPDAGGAGVDSGTMDAGLACDPLAQEGCASTETCVLDRGVPGCAAAGSVEAGGGCDVSAECLPGHICAPFSQAGGTCWQTCDPRAEVDPCPSGTECHHLAELLAVCMAPL